MPDLRSFEEQCQDDEDVEDRQVGDQGWECDSNATKKVSSILYCTKYKKEKGKEKKVAKAA